MNSISREAGLVLSRKQILVLLLLAVALRLAYVGMVGWFGGDFNNGSDSGKFIKRALSLLEHGEIVYLDFGVLIPDTARMPGYPYFLAGIFDLFGHERLWIVSVFQAFIDGSTVIAIGFLAGSIDRRWALPAAGLACVWATLIVYASFVLSDTLFLAFFTWGLCACVWATRSRHKALLMVAAGISFSLALQTRTTLMFFPYLILPLTAYLLWSVSGMRWYRAIVFAAIPAILIILSVVPQVVRNNANYGHPVVTTQSGNHAMDVVDQFLRACPQCIVAGMEDQMHGDLKIRLAALPIPEQRNPVILNGVRRDVALDYLKQLPLSAMIRGTISGVLRSTSQTAVYETGHQMRWNPQFFSAIRGDDIAKRIFKFTKTVATDPFLLIWAFAQAATLLALLFQIVGTFNGIRRRTERPYVIFLLAIAAYFLILNGPFGNARYGMPLTPVMAVLTAAGLLALIDHLRERIEEDGTTATARPEG
jgi:4-amino-4-deoxy-L-arabinose transferase-like glycosyltransferase